MDHPLLDKLHNYTTLNLKSKPIFPALTNSYKIVSYLIACNIHVDTDISAIGQYQAVMLQTEISVVGPK